MAVWLVCSWSGLGTWATEYTVTASTVISTASTPSTQVPANPIRRRIRFRRLIRASRRFFAARRRRHQLRPSASAAARAPVAARLPPVAARRPPPRGPPAWGRCSPDTRLLLTDCLAALFADGSHRSLLYGVATVRVVPEHSAGSPWPSGSGGTRLAGRPGSGGPRTRRGGSVATARAPAGL